LDERGLHRCLAPFPDDSADHLASRGERIDDAPGRIPCDRATQTDDAEIAVDTDLDEDRAPRLHRVRRARAVQADRRVAECELAIAGHLRVVGAALDDDAPIALHADTRLARKAGAERAAHRHAASDRPYTVLSWHPVAFAPAEHFGRLGVRFTQLVR